MSGYREEIKAEHGSRWWHWIAWNVPMPILDAVEFAWDGLRAAGGMFLGQWPWERWREIQDERERIRVAVEKAWRAVMGDDER